MSDLARRTFLSMAGAFGFAALATKPSSTASAAHGEDLGGESYFAIPVAEGGGPAATNLVHVLRVGPATAETVLVLVPDVFGAANGFRLLARDLVERVPGVQVWAFDRREQGMADLTGFMTPDPVGYYMEGHYRRQDPAASPYVGDWGLCRVVEDLDVVVRLARASGRRVVLGGNSWGATTALAYAAWDFEGRPGYRGLAGLVLIDGGVHGALAGEDYDPQNSPEQVRNRLAAIQAGAVFDMTPSRTGLGNRAESSQIWYQLAGWYAHRDPKAPSVLQPRLPASHALPNPVTNEALLGTLVDASFRWPNILSVHSGHLATSGDVRDWIDDGITPIARVATAYAGPDPAAWEWYGPARLSVDLDVAYPYTDTALARSLGLRLRHATELDIPLYAFETSLTNGTVLSSARWVVANSRIPQAAYYSDTAMNHLDPLFAAPAHNTVTRTLPQFLAQLG